MKIWKQNENIYVDLEYLNNLLKRHKSKKKIFKEKNNLLKFLKESKEMKKQELKGRDNVRKLKKGRVTKPKK